MLPKSMREKLFEKMSVKTMRYVDSVPSNEAQGLVKDVYDQVTDDFFINGTITSHSKVPELMAGMWMCGREIVLIGDKVDYTTKEAMSATLSQVNDCPYCADMLLGLVNGGGEHEVANRILFEREDDVGHERMREILTWAKAAAGAGPAGAPPPPFADDELPEAIGCLFMFSYVNRFSHVVMDGSPVTAPFGLMSVKGAALRIFGALLRYTTEKRHEPGRALTLLPPASLPEAFAWAAPNARIADALARWAMVVDTQANEAVPSAVRSLVEGSLARWNGERPPISRAWVDAEIEALGGDGLSADERAIARMALVVGKASWQFDDGLAEAVLGTEADQARFIRVLAWASFVAARRVAERMAEGANKPSLKAA